MLINETSNDQYCYRISELSTDDNVKFTVTSHATPLPRGYVVHELAWRQSEGNALVLAQTRSAGMIRTELVKKPSYPGLLLLPEKRTDIVWAINGDAREAFALRIQDLNDYLRQEDSPHEAGSLASVYVAQLSPDGKYALLLVLQDDLKHRQYSLLMLRLSDMTLREVQGIDASTVLYGDASFDFKPLIEWNADRLSILTKDGLGVYRFE